MEKREEQGGLWFSTNTPQQARKAIINAYENKYRVRVWLGDTETGKVWAEENDILGYIGRSTGTQKIPLLIYSNMSSGGDGLLDHCVLGIQSTHNKQFTYKHPKMYIPNMSIVIDETRDDLQFCVYIEESLRARFKTHGQAERYMDFMSGKRMNK